MEVGGPRWGSRQGPCSGLHSPSGLLRTWAHGVFCTSEFREGTPPGADARRGRVGTRHKPSLPHLWGTHLRQVLARSPCPPGLLAGPGPAALGGRLFMHHRPWPLSLHTSFPSMTGVTAQMHFRLQVPILGCFSEIPNMTLPHCQRHAKGTVSPTSLFTSFCAVPT